MIYEIEQSQFKNISHLLVGDRCNPEIKAVVELNNPGWIFVDNPIEPKTAVVWSKGIKGFYFVGDEDNSQFNNYINDYIENIIIPRAKELGLSSFECSGISDKWDDTIQELFSKRKLQKSYQCVYRFKNFKSYSFIEEDVDESYKIVRIGNELINSSLDNKDFLTSEILLFWNSLEDFFDKGIGVCAMDGKVIASRCTSGFVSGNIQTINIETLQGYRRKGLGKKTAIEFLKYCKENKYEPYWECMKKNTASAFLAESIGFSKDYEYPLYEFDFQG